MVSLGSVTLFYKFREKEMTGVDVNVGCFDVMLLFLPSFEQNAD